MATHVSYSPTVNFGANNIKTRSPLDRHPTQTAIWRAFDVRKLAFVFKKWDNNS